MPRQCANPSGFLPSANDGAGSGFGYVRFQRKDVVGGEGVGQTVKDGAVLRVAAGVVSVGGILLAEDVAEEAALLLKDVFGHHQREVDDVRSACR